MNKKLEWLDKPKKNSRGMIYFKWQFFSVIGVIWIAAIETFLKPVFKLGSSELFFAEVYFLITFSTDFFLRIGTGRWHTKQDRAFLALDALTLTGSVYVIAHWFGHAPEVNGFILAFMQLLRAARSIKILRKLKIVEAAFGKSILTEVIPYGIFSVLPILACAMLQKAMPQFGTEFPITIMLAAAGLLATYFGLVVANAFSQAFNKSYDLSQIVASLYASIRAFIDDPAEIGGKKIINQNDLPEETQPLRIESKIQKFLKGSLNEKIDIRIAVDNWVTAGFRIIRNKTDFKTDLAAQAIMTQRADNLVGLSWKMVASSKHRLAEEFYRVMEFISWGVFLCLLVPFSTTLGGSLALVMIKVAASALLLALKDCDRPTDPDLDKFNPAMPQPLAQHPTRS